MDAGICLLRGTRRVTGMLVLLQAVVGLMLYQSVNANPSKPGILTVFHQGMAMVILLSIFFGWRVTVPFLG